MGEAPHISGKFGARGRALPQDPLQMPVALHLSMANSMGRRIFEGVLEFANAHPDLRWRFHIPLNQEQTIFPAERPVAGVIAQVSCPDLLAEWDAQGLPRVNVSSFLEDPDGPKVGVDNEAVGREAAHHFLRRHFRQFAFLGLKGAHYSRMRAKGFVDALQLSGKSEFFASMEMDAGAGYLDLPLSREVAEWVAALPKPVALFAATDGLARRALETCEKAPHRCPDDISVVGVDNDDLECAVSPVKLSSVVPPFHAIGYQAAALLADLMAAKGSGSPNPLTRCRTLPPLGIMTRQSSESLAVEEPVVGRALHFIRENARRDLSVSEVAAACGVSRRYLERHFRTLLDSSPKGEIMRHRIQQVRLMLAETSLTVGEIADRLSYQEPKYLHRAFRRECGRSPMEYRRLFRR